MDVGSRPLERVFSILNDNNCPSFVVRQRNSCSEAQTRPFPKSPKQERPSLLRQTQYKRTSSISSSSSSTSPPLLRYDSSSSKSSNSSMDSSPSPITPAYHYNDTALLPYDNVLRQDMNGFLQPPTTITPFMEQQMMIAPMADPFPVKGLPPMLPAQYPILPAPAAPADPAQLSTPTSLNPASNSLSNNNSPPSNTSPNVKKNKYPCPYAQTQSCSATFTTSGHAARHGKKHTGEKGVHCPVCNKAFTRKDNMKQHERTHKNSISGTSDESNSRRSKAAITRDAQKNKQVKKSDSTASNPSTQPSLLQSPLSEVTSAVPSLDAPMGLQEQAFYATEPTNQVMPVMPVQPIPDNLSPNSLYPPITNESLMAAANSLSPSTADKLVDMSAMSAIPMPPTLIRGFSDLDTLAQAAETFDPYYQPAI
jgi:Zinc finger, C2H2 type